VEFFVSIPINGQFHNCQSLSFITVHDLVYALESVLPVGDKSYHMNNGFQQMWAEIKNLWNHAYKLKLS